MQRRKPEPFNQNDPKQTEPESVKGLDAGTPSHQPLLPHPAARIPLVKLEQVRPNRPNPMALMIENANDPTSFAHRFFARAPLEVSKPNEPPRLGWMPVQQDAQATWMASLQNETAPPRQVLEAIKPYLEQHEASDLRAEYAQAQFRTANFETAFEQAERAWLQQQTSSTLLAYGQALSLQQPEAALEHLQQGLQLAEADHDDQQALRCLCAIVQTQIRLGRYRTAKDWAEWGSHLEQTSDHSKCNMKRLLQQVQALIGSDVKTAPAAPQGNPLDHFDLLLASNQFALALEQGQQVWREKIGRAHV